MEDSRYAIAFAGKIDICRLYASMYCAHRQVCYVDTDEIPGFFLSLKIISSLREVNIPFLSFTCENIGVVMVTNTIS